MRFDAAHPHEHVFKVAGLMDLSTGWYRPWYLNLRLEEEIQRATRYHRDLSLVFFKVGNAASDEPAYRLELLETIADIGGHLPTTDLPGLGERDEYVIVLPETDLPGARLIGERLQRDLEAFAPVVSVVAYPQDGDTAAGLLASARILAASAASTLSL